MTPPPLQRKRPVCERAHHAPVAMKSDMQEGGVVAPAREWLSGATWQLPYAVADAGVSTRKWSRLLEIHRVVASSLPGETGAAAHSSWAAPAAPWTVACGCRCYQCRLASWMATAVRAAGAGDATRREATCDGSTATMGGGKGRAEGGGAGEERDEREHETCRNAPSEGGKQRQRYAML